MSTQVWIARAIWFLSLLGVPNVVLADATPRTGDQVEIKLGGVPAADIPFVSGVYRIDGGGSVGDFSAFTDQRKVRLLRGNDVMIIGVKKIRTNPSLDLQLQPGDRVEVPQ